jgi:predicted nucleic acid-binding protein
LKRVVADTSAMVSVALSGQLGLAVESISFFVPEVVKKELRELSAYHDLAGIAAKRALSLMNKGKINLAPVKGKANAEKLVDRNTDLGEAECFILASEKKIPVLLLDDLDAAYSLNGLARARNISIKISAAVIVELVKRGRLNKKQAVASLHRMIQSRKWEKSVLEYLIGKYVRSL